MLGDQQHVVIIAIAVIIGLEIWRRSLANRTPRWVHVVTFALFAMIAGAVMYTWWALGHLFESISDEAAGNKTSVLSRGISHAMLGNAIAVGSVIVAVLVLAIATWRARPPPT